MEMQSARHHEIESEFEKLSKGSVVTLLAVFPSAALRCCWWPKHYRFHRCWKVADAGALMLIPHFHVTTAHDDNSVFLLVCAFVQPLLLIPAHELLLHERSASLLRC